MPGAVVGGDGEAFCRCGLAFWCLMPLGHFDVGGGRPRSIRGRCYACGKLGKAGGSWRRMVCVC